MGEAGKDAWRVGFDRTLKLAFHGARVSSDAGLLPYRDLDEAAGLIESVAAELFDGSSGLRVGFEPGLCPGPRPPVSVLWAEPGGRFTAMFEALVIDWLGEASIAAVSRQLGLSWDEVDTVMKRAVARGLWRREHEPAAEKSPGVRHVALDEMSQRRGHRYLTVVSDREHGHVVHVEPARKRASLSAFYEKQGEGGCAAIAAVTMDMWGPYIASTRKHVPDADEKIAFDKFHVAQHLGDAIDKVRRREHKRRKAEGDEQLAGTRSLWLKHPKNVSDRDWRGRFKALRESTLQTARAWAIRETAMSLWHYRSRTWATQVWATKAWRRGYAWAIRSRLEPVKRIARMVKRPLQGIVNAVALKATNARAESINNRIQRVKRLACGFRNTQRFQRAICFHLAALDLHPRPSTHTKA